jgi:hypothetical protein
MPSASPQIRRSTSHTSPSFEKRWSVIGTAPGPSVGKVVSLGVTATLVNDTDGLDQSVVASILRVLDIPTPTGLLRSFGETPSTLPEPGWRWVSVQLDNHERRIGRPG